MPGTGPGMTAFYLWTDFISRGLDRALAHPAPDQRHILIRRVVEPVPAVARRIDHIALHGRLLAGVGVNVALALEHDEERVAIAQAMALMARARLEHRPADDMIGAGGLLVDQ